MGKYDKQFERLKAMQSDKTDFKREIGVFGGVNILVGVMIGSGIFYLGSIVMMRTGMSQGFALLCWVIGGIVSLLQAFCYAELGAMLPKAGGSYVYLREAYSPAIAFMSGASQMIFTAGGSIAGLALALAAIVPSFIPALSSMAAQKAVAVFFILLLTVINILGVKFGAAVQNVFTVAKLFPIIIIIALGLFMGKEPVNLSVVPAAGVSAGSWIGMLGTGVVASLWAYTGWTTLNLVSEEIKNPAKNLPRALIYSICGVTVIYTLFNFAIYRTVPFGTISESIAATPPDLYMGTRAAEILMGPVGLTLVSVGMLVSIFGSLNANVMAFPRSYYAMAKDGAVFRALGTLHPRTQTPVVATLVSAALAIAFTLLRSLDQVTSLVVFSNMLYSLMTLAAVFVFRKRFPDLPRPYKVKGYPYIVIITLLIQFALLMNTLISDPVTSISGLIVPAMFYAFYKWQHKNDKTVADETAT